MTTTDARKRRHERDMAEAHATARARIQARMEAADERLLEAIDRFRTRDRTHTIDPTTGQFTPIQEAPMNPASNRSRHAELVALLTEIRDNTASPQVVNIAPDTRVTDLRRAGYRVEVEDPTDSPEPCACGRAVPCRHCEADLARVTTERDTLRKRVDDLLRERGETSDEMRALRELIKALRVNIASGGPMGGVNWPKGEQR